MENKTYGDDNQKKMEPAGKLPNRKFGYFRDDQIRFLVTHEKEEVTTEQLEAFQKHVDGYLGEYGPIILPGALTYSALKEDEPQQLEKLVLRDESKTITSAFSLLQCYLTRGPEDPAELLNILQELLDNDVFTATNVEGLTIQGLSPDWLSSVVSQGSGTGGPGGVPSPYYGGRRSAHYKFDLVQRLADCEIYGDGTGVDVVILDTAPSAHDLVAAHKEWSDHPLIETLLGPRGKLHLHPTSYRETLRLGNLSLNSSDYKMTDHGLFIAGIIHSIVPNAEIHLIEVLNQNGVGDLTSFAVGMWKALYSSNIGNGDPSRRRVINCSWMFDIPVDEGHCYHSKKPYASLVDPDLEFERQVKTFVDKNLRTIYLMLETFFNRSYDLGHGSIAAAGNDAYDDEINVKHIRPQARYPAGLTKVVGVGALPVTLEKHNEGVLNGKYKTSAFSNRSDRPERNGIATLGGEVGEGKGVLGLYIGEFPDGRRNLSKWAWWAGTSFATPVLSGAVASILSNGGTSTTTQEAIEELYGHKIIKDDQTEFREDVLPTTQC